MCVAVLKAFVTVKEINWSDGSEEVSFGHPCFYCTSNHTLLDACWVSIKFPKSNVELLGFWQLNVCSGKQNWSVPMNQEQLLCWLLWWKNLQLNKLELSSIIISKINLLEVRGGKKRVCTSQLSSTFFCPLFVPLFLFIIFFLLLLFYIGYDACSMLMLLHLIWVKILFQIRSYLNSNHWIWFLMSSNRKLINIL